MDDDIILSALQTALIAAVAANAPTLSGAIMGVGRTLKTPNEQKMIELVFLPNNRTGDFWGAEKNYQGTFRIILHWPNDDAGAYPPMAVLKAVCGYFTHGMRLGDVQIYEAPNFLGSIESGAETLYPASLRYQSFRP